MMQEALEQHRPFAQPLSADAVGQSVRGENLCARHPLVNRLTESISFYFDVGLYEPQFIPAHKQLVPLLQAKGCPCLFQELEGGHNWTSWRAHLKDLLTFLWGKETVEEAERIPGITRARPPQKKPPGTRRQPAHSGTPPIGGI